MYPHGGLCLLDYQGSKCVTLNFSQVRSRQQHIFLHTCTYQLLLGQSVVLAWLAIDLRAKVWLNYTANYSQEVS